jgi:hypothetical protein
LRVFKEALGYLPEGVQKVRLRSDTAGYQPVLKYCDAAKNERFGRIEFAIGCDVTREFKNEVAKVEECEWNPIYKIVNGKKERTRTDWALPFWRLKTIWGFVALPTPGVKVL